MMRKFCLKCLWVTAGPFALVFAVYAFVWFVQTQPETLTRIKSPNGKWNISEEYSWTSSTFRIILRDSAGNEIARTNERFVKPYLIDSPSDHQWELEITDEIAGANGQPIWRREASGDKWHVIPPE